MSVKNWIGLTYSKYSSLEKSIDLTFIEFSKLSTTLFKTNSSFWDCLFPVFATLETFSNFFCATSKSFNWSSISMICLSLTGSIDPSTWTILSLSKHLRTCIIASVSRIFARNLFPKPSPLLAPLTNPAISTISTVAGITFSGSTRSFNLSSLLSGTFITPTFGSIVQNGN